MTHHFRRFALAATAMVALAAPAAKAGVGDLLVAPTRVILEGGRGTEILLNNIGDEEATYRITAEFRRMGEDGSLQDVELPNELESAARDMVVFAPRRITLPPKQPQAIRIAARAPAGLADGEYRVHLLFRAIPKPRAVEAETKSEGLSFRLTPVYGVTIPVIVRLGRLDVEAAIADVRVADYGVQKVVAVDITRAGQRSTFGTLAVLKAGEEEPIAFLNGVAIYPEVGQRTVNVPLRADYAGALDGPVTVEYRLPQAEGGGIIASTQTTLR
ncbi:molecular chaperone [Sphingomicrobium flavum]|uniref:molecular chaperone n=1 Tax=Sphingomicrobium flavum TaxID=1229164 RepID=UPI0021AD8404|nr:molecular chaperone [Sphingomicrobium flavum]